MEIVGTVVPIFLQSTRILSYLIKIRCWIYRVFRNTQSVVYTFVIVILANPSKQIFDEKLHEYER